MAAVTLINQNLDEYLQPLIERCIKADFAIAFITKSGTDLLLPKFSRSLRKKPPVRVVFSATFGFTEARALRDLASYGASLHVYNPRGEESGILHAKLWVFYLNRGEVGIIIGSSNLTKPALKSNNELNIGILGNDSDPFVQACIKQFDTYWKTTNSNVVTPEFIDLYEKNAPTFRNARSEAVKQLTDIVQQAALTEVQAKSGFRDVILKALQSGPRTTKELYNLAGEQVPYLCDDSYWRTLVVRSISNLT